MKVSAEKMLAELQNTSSLSFVASPLLKFKSLNNEQTNTNWKNGQSYSYSLFLFGLIPLGKHKIHISMIDNQNMRLLSNESGTFVKGWIHQVLIQQVSPNQTKYTDEVEIKAGILTLFIWLFGLIFYSHRHRRWKKYFTR